MSVNRYEFEDYGTNEDDGRYVTYEDYVALEARCAALAVENAGLKSFGDKLDEMHNDLNGEGTGIQGRAEVACQQVALEAAMEEFDTIKTPATDAFLAEVRAQGADECVRQLVTSDDDGFSDAPNICAMVAHQLRKGVQS